MLNIVKHSKATKVTIKSLYKQNIFSLEIEDNGIGFNQKKVKKKDGIGLDLMRERAELVHGNLCIYSKEKSGTIITLNIPIQENEKHA